MGSTLTVETVVTTLYSKSWVARTFKKLAEIGVSVTDSLTEDVLLLLSLHLSKVQTLLKSLNHESTESLSSSPSLFISFRKYFKASSASAREHLEAAPGGHTEEAQRCLQSSEQRKSIQNSEVRECSIERPIPREPKTSDPTQEKPFFYVPKSKRTDASYVSISEKLSVCGERIIRGHENIIRQSDNIIRQSDNIIRQSDNIIRQSGRIVDAIGRACETAEGILNQLGDYDRLLDIQHDASDWDDRGGVLESSERVHVYNGVTTVTVDAKEIS